MRIYDPETKKNKRLRDEFQTGKINFQVVPTSGDLSSIVYPSFIEVPIKYKYGGKITLITHELAYRVGGDSLIDMARSRQQGEKVWYICNRGFYSCKRPAFICQGCNTRRDRNHDYGLTVRIAKDKEAHEAKQKEEGKKQREENAAAKKERKEREKEAEMDKLMQLVMPPPKSTVPCFHATEGRCMKGVRCRLSHEGLDFTVIPCQLRRIGDGTRCVLKDKCPYTHAADEEAEPTLNPEPKAET